jgi:hypothetical protein
MILATWNVLSLHRPGALAKLKDELSEYGVAFAAVQETRWCGCDIFLIWRFHCMLQSEAIWTGFLIHKNYKQLVRFQVLMAASVKLRIFCDVLPCS